MAVAAFAATHAHTRTHAPVRWRRTSTPFCGDTMAVLACSVQPRTSNGEDLRALMGRHQNGERRPKAARIKRGQGAISAAGLSIWSMCDLFGMRNFSGADAMHKMAPAMAGFCVQRAYSSVFGDRCTDLLLSSVQIICTLTAWLAASSGGKSAGGLPSARSALSTRRTVSTLRGVSAHSTPGGGLGLPDSAA